ncbi:MAG: polymorphic toxin type 50 domain-containing protein [Turicibacter sp.]|nr:polymorphic toxin type 50 domain-containing protein [Turicibacter sp.]
MDGTYPTKIDNKKQNAHILGSDTIKKRVREGLTALKANPPRNRMPSYLYSEIDPQQLVDTHKASGVLRMHPTSTAYPRENVRAFAPVGKYFDISSRSWVETDTLTIVYSSTGVHTYPIDPNEYGG